MNACTYWQRVAERIAEAGWSWSHCTRSDRMGRIVHIAEAHNDDGQKHVTVGKTIRPVFVALERSIKNAK